MGVRSLPIEGGKKTIRLNGGSVARLEMIRAVALAVLFVAFAAVTAVLEDAWSDPVIRVLRSADAPTNDFIDSNITISTNETVPVVQEASNACLVYTPFAALIAAIVSFLL